MIADTQTHDTYIYDTNMFIEKLARVTQHEHISTC